MSPGVRLRGVQKQRPVSKLESPRIPPELLEQLPYVMLHAETIAALSWLVLAVHLFQVCTWLPRAWRIHGGAMGSWCRTSS